MPERDAADGNYAAVRPGSSTTGGEQMQTTDRNVWEDQISRIR